MSKPLQTLWDDSPDLGHERLSASLGFDAGDANFYRYVRNAPTDRNDPTGLDEVKPSRVPPAKPISELPEWAQKAYASMKRLHELDPSLKLSDIKVYSISRMKEGDVGYPISDKSYYKEGTPEFELALLDDLLRQAYPEVFSKLGGKISQGFIGNAFQYPNCTAIHGAMNDVITEMMRKIGYSFKHYEIVSILHSPGWPNAHIYIGIRKKDTEKLIAFADPWRGFEKYSEWRPISEDSYTRDELNAWPTKYKVGPTEAQEIQRFVAALSTPLLTAAYVFQLKVNPPKLLYWQDTPQGKK
jgi:hypothetical protein